MILTTHALTGAVIGKNIGSPWLIIIVSLAVHFLMDTLRHGEYVESFDSKAAFKNTWWKFTLDLVAAFALIALFINFKKLTSLEIRNILTGSFFSMFPDLLTLLYWKFRLNFLLPLYKFHTWVHRYPGFSKEREWNLKNATNDILISIIALVLLFL
jgi:hypothetical protein